MFVATSQEVQKIAITLTSSRHTLVHKRIQPTKVASDGGENIPVHLSVRKLERLEKKNWKKKRQNAENVLDVYHVLARLQVEERLALSGV